MGNTLIRDIGNTFEHLHIVSIYDNGVFHNHEKGKHPCHGKLKSLLRKSARNSSIAGPKATLRSGHSAASTGYHRKRHTNGESATLGRGQKFVYRKKLSKPIIDEIDELLAKHYGFTEEELDFIINYDIKYRMGDELNAGE